MGWLRALAPEFSFLAVPLSAFVMMNASLPTLQLSVNVVVAVNNAVDPVRYGEVNGLASTTSALGRALAPFTCAPLFAWSINADHPFPFGPHFSFILLALGMLAFSIVAWRRIGSDQNPEQSRGEHIEMAPVGDLV